MAALQARIEASGDTSFGGMYIRHEPRLQVVVKFKGDEVAKLKRYTRASLFVAEHAPFTLTESRDAQAAVAKELSPANEFLSTLDIPNSLVEVGVKPELANALAMNRQAVGASPLRFFATAGFIKPTIEMQAGSWMVGPEQYCTSGFSVTNGTKYGILTAGHCDNQIKYSNSKALTFAAEMDVGSDDFRWHTGGSYDYFRPWMYNGSQNIVIKGVMKSAELPVGFFVCKYGKNTLLTCGDIADNASQSMHKGQVGTYVRVHQQHGYEMTRVGDSGGPVYVLQSAVGLIHGRGSAGTA